jgi:hypothetical protein
LGLSPYETGLVTPGRKEQRDLEVILANSKRLLIPLPLKDVQPFVHGSKISAVSLSAEILSFPDLMKF